MNKRPLKKRLQHFIQVNILPIVISSIAKIIYYSNKKVFHFAQLAPKNDPFILLMWHREGLMQPFNYKKFKPNGTVKSIVSEHRDGEMIKEIFKNLGIGAIDGSSTRGGVKALINAIKNIKSGVDVAITPDGPRGPIYSIADGPVAISQKTNAKLVVFSMKPTKYWKLKTWDKYIIPKPFGTIHFYVSDFFDVNGLSMEEAKLKIKNKMIKNSILE